MITGVIRETGAPIIALHILGTREREATVEGILDTGFDGFLCLPIPIAVSLGLEFTDVIHMELADGTIVENELAFAGRAEWDGTVMDVEIVLTRSADVLIGTAFLKGYVVQLDYKSNIIRIEKAP